MSASAALEEVRELVPGLVCATILLIPDGLELSSTGDPGALGNEPFVRAARRVFGGDAESLPGSTGSPAVQYALLVDDRVIVLQRGRREPRLVLAVMCRRDVNVAFLLATTRQALVSLETKVNIDAFDG